MIRFFLVGLALAMVGPAIAQAPDVYNALNRAGEQRMLAQRIAKSYTQIGLNVLPLPAMQEIEAAIVRFEDNLKALDATAKSNVTQASLQRLREVWAPLRTAARGLPRREAAIWLSHQADQVLAAAEVHVRNLQTTTPGNSGRLVAQAGRQRMLSQRIAKSYLLLSWGDTSEVTREELASSITEFSTALRILRQRAENTPQINQELEEMAQHWEWLQAALAIEGAVSYRLIVTEAAEAILGAADRLTALYEQLPR